MAEPEPDLADHERRSVEAIAAVHREHARQTPPMQRAIDSVTALFARPAAIAVIVLLVVAWVVWNGWRAAHGLPAADPPPFALLELVAAVCGVILATLILATQRRESLLEEQRSQLSLELALQNEEKTAKLIALIEELRRDHPSIADRPDAESEAMSKPADAETVLGAIQQAADEKA